MPIRRRFTASHIAAVVIGLTMALSVSQMGATTLITLPDPQLGAALYGNAYSYSLNVLGISVQSSPGQIQDDIVVATGASGTGVNTNAANMDNAYGTPSGTGGLPYFSTGQTGLFTTTRTAPGSSSAFTTFDSSNQTTWNTTIGALQNYLNNGGTTQLFSPVLFFNNNQENSGSTLNQQLAIWGQAIVRDSSGNLLNHWTFSNVDIGVSPFNNGDIGISGSNVITGGFGGILTGPDKNPSFYSAPLANDIYPLGATGTTPSLNDFVLSGGQDCFTASLQLVSCSDPSVAHVINNNLGANLAAYAVIVPGLNSILGSLDPTDFLQLDIRMGCNSAFYGSTCPLGLSLNNGFEQIFIGQGIITQNPPPPPNVIPEPCSLLLISAGLLGIGFYKRTTAKKKN